MRASYGSSNYIICRDAAGADSLRSVIGRLELDKTSRSAMINAQVVAAIDEAALNWGEGAALRDQGSTPPAERSCAPWQAQIAAERG